MMISLRNFFKKCFMVSMILLKFFKKKHKGIIKNNHQTFFKKKLKEKTSRWYED